MFDDEDEDDALAGLETPHPDTSKKPRTPQYLGGGRRLFVEDNDDFNEISQKLKLRLSNAFSQLPTDAPHHFSLDTTPWGETLPTRTKRVLWHPGLNVVNVNLADNNDQQPVGFKFGGAGSGTGDGILKSTLMPYLLVADDALAHQALMATISRQRRKRRSFSHKRTTSLDEVIRSGKGLPRPLQSPQFKLQPPLSPNGRPSLRLPPLTASLDSKHQEQDAVLLLMQLSLPRATTHRQVDRLDQSPQLTKGPRLPPIRVPPGGDDDATDVDDDATEDEDEG